MARVPEEDDVGPLPGHAFRALAPMLLLLAVAALLLTLTAVTVSADGNVTWATPTADCDVREELYVSVRVSANVTNVTFLHNSTAGDVVIGNGTFTAPDIYSIQWETEDVPDGTYRISANASLAGGGYETASVDDIRVDNRDPTAHFIDPLDNARLNGYHTIRIETSTDAVSVDVLIDVGNWFEALGTAQKLAGTQNWTLTWNSTVYEEEITNVSFMAIVTDAAGNEIRIVVDGIEIDNVAPVANLAFPVDNATLDAYVHLKGTTSEPHVVDVYFEYRVGTGAWQPISDANWNQGMGFWMYQWNTYLVGEASGVEVRMTVVDDLGQTGTSSAFNVTITDLPPAPEFLSPSDNDHLCSITTISVVSQNDTASVMLSYHDGTGWVDIGAADQVAPQVWNLTWDTSGLSLLETQLRANAFDATGNGSVALTGIEIDNTAPEPNIQAPDKYQYHLFGSVSLKLISDRDTVSVVFHYLDGDEWVLFYQLVYNPNTDRWIGVWDIPSDLYIAESSICATATDEVGLTGTDILDHREIGIPPGDIAPSFRSTMIEVIVLDEDQQNYVLELGDHISDNDKSTLKVYVTGQPEDLFYVDGENVTGNLDLRFYTLPDAYGEAQVQIHVYDPKGQSAVATLQVIVASVPDPPRFTDVPPNLFVRPDVTYTFDFLPYIADPDSSIEDLSILLPDDKHVSKHPTNPMALEFDFSTSETGKSFTVNVTVRDDTGLIAWMSIMVWVVDDWVPELRKPLPDIWMDEDEDKVDAFDLDAYFFDQDKDALYYSYGNKSVRVVIGNEAPHSVSIYPPKDWHGTDSVTFRATDPTGALLEDTIVIHCNSTNDAPYFVDFPRLPDLVIRHNVSYDLDLSPYVKDVDHELGELTVHTLDPGVTRSPVYTLGIRLFYPKMPSSFIVEIIIEDPEGASTEPRSINVLVSDNYPPIMQSPPPDLVMREEENRAQAFNVTSAHDPDWLEGAPGTWRDLTFEFLGGPMTFAISDTGWVSVELPDSDYNTYGSGTNNPVLVLFRVKDTKGGFTEYLFRVTVTPVNDAPVLTPIEIEIPPSTVAIDLRPYVRDVDTPFPQLKFEVKDATDPGKVISYVSVHGWLLVMKYDGTESHVDRLLLIATDSDHQEMTTLVVKVVAKEEEPAGFSMWIILAVVVLTGSVAVVASKFVWGRFEPPSVSDVFLVYGDGVIIRHMSKRGTMSMDEDLAIAMLTAIQEFVQQSMRSAQLKSMQAGENNILIERDPSRLFYIAVIHTGTVTEELRKAINFATRSIKEEYGEVLKKWDGNIALFEGVDRYLDQVLAISHASIPEGVRFEMEGITSIEPGKTYMFQGKDATRTHNIFRGLVEDQGSGLLISRVHPQRLHPSVPESGAECIWLSKTPTKRGVSPSNTTMILHEITTFVKDEAHPRSVVCLDGLEYLLVHNPLDEVVSFVSELTDMAQVDDFIMMIHVDPFALDDATLARLSRNMVPVSDRTPPNGK